MITKIATILIACLSIALPSKSQEIGSEILEICTKAYSLPEDSSILTILNNNTTFKLEATHGWSIIPPKYLSDSPEVYSFKPIRYIDSSINYAVINAITEKSKTGELIRVISIDIAFSNIKNSDKLFNELDYAFTKLSSNRIKKKNATNTINYSSKKYKRMIILDQYKASKNSNKKNISIQLDFL